MHDATDWPAHVPTDEEIQARRASVRAKVEELRPYVRSSPRPAANREAFVAMLRRDQVGGRGPVRRNPCGNVNHPGFMEWETANPFSDRIAEAEKEYAGRIARKSEPPKFDPDAWTE